MSDEVLRTARLLFEPGQVVEVRAIADDGIASGYFDDLEKLASQAEVLDGTHGVQGIYVTLNQVNPPLLARRSNRVKMKLSKKDVTTADSDILHRRWFPVDIDPARPSGVSSADAEHQAAITRAAEISAYLGRECGWPAPVLADSGNGAHLLYRIDLPNDDESRDLVRRCLDVLALIFGDDVADIDTANHNAARIWKLYGTVSRKGDNTPDRPHRRSAILDVPVQVVPVDRKLLEQLAASLPASSPEQEPRARGHPIDLAVWLRDHGIGVVREKPYQGGTLYVLDECPFSGAHRDGAFAIQFGNGAVHAGCQHASCGGGSQRWPELREKFEPKAGRTAVKSKTPEKGSRNGASASSAPDDLPGLAEAREILHHGDPKQAMLETFYLDHEGDRVVAECMILSFASRSVENTNGLHVSVSGESGKGKSHAFSTMIEQVPARFRPADRMSNKALFYAEGLGLVAGSVVVFDDSSLSEEMAEILKGVTSNFRRPYRYWTVSRDRKGQECTIPERCVWWVAKVEGVGDDQVFNRMLTCWIDDSAEQDDRCVNRSLCRDAELPVDQGDERPEILVCRAMWEEIGSQRFHVVIPFARRIRFRSRANRRNPEILLDLIKANAVMRFLQREQVASGRIRCLMAARQDFDDAARLFGLLNGTAGGQETKLTRKESDLLAAIRNGGFVEFTIPQLQRTTGLSNGALHKVLHGFKSRGCLHSGLLEKCPAISFTDRSVTTEEEPGLCMRRRTNAYTFDPGVYETWMRGGSVWLDDGPDGPQGTGGPGCPSTPSTDFSHTSPTGEGFRKNSADSDPPDKESTKDIALSTGHSFHKNENSREASPHRLTEPAGPCDPETGEVWKSEISQEAQIPAVDQLGEVPYRSYPSPCPSMGEEMWKCGREGHSLPEPGTVSHGPCLPDQVHAGIPVSSEIPSGPGNTPSLIHARAYKLLDAPEPSSCHVCGARWSHYVEKLTDERRRRPKDQQMARRICKACYQAAKEAAQKAAVVLPGTFEGKRLERVKVSVGRCTVCDLESAVYFDRSSDVRLCEPCYRRMAKSSEQGEAVG